MAMRSSLSRNAGQYIYAFLWLVIALGVVSAIHLVSSIIPKQDIVIGGYNVTTVASQYLVTNTITYTTPVTAVGTFRIILGFTVDLGGWGQGQSGSCYTYDSGGYYNIIFCNDTLREIRLSKSAVDNNRITYLSIATPFEIININLTSYSGTVYDSKIGGTAYVYNPPISPHRSNTAIILNMATKSETVKTATQATLTVTTTTTSTITQTLTTTYVTIVPSDNAVSISNRTFIELIGFGVFVLISIIAVNKLLKMIV